MAYRAWHGKVKQERNVNGVTGCTGPAWTKGEERRGLPRENKKVSTVHWQSHQTKPEEK